MLRTILAVTMLFAPMSVSFAQGKPVQPVLKVAVMADGRIVVNGAPATIQSLRESLKKLSQQKGVVWYYREAANTEGSPVVKQVVRLLSMRGFRSDSPVALTIPMPSGQMESQSSSSDA